MARSAVKACAHVMERRQFDNIPDIGNAACFGYGNADEIAPTLFDHRFEIPYRTEHFANSDGDRCNFSDKLKPDLVIGWCGVFESEEIIFLDLSAKCGGLTRA